MKFVNIKSSCSREHLYSMLCDSERVNKHVKFDEKTGRPHIKLSERFGLLFMTCEMIGGSGRDNGFLVGTFFVGKLSSKGDGSRLRGLILTAPLYHLALIGFCIYFLIQSFIVGGITLVPILLVVFNYFLFKDEFKKQGIIKRFAHRAARMADEEE